MFSTPETSVHVGDKNREISPLFDSSTVDNTHVFHCIGLRYMLIDDAHCPKCNSVCHGHMVTLHAVHGYDYNTAVHRSRSWISSLQDGLRYTMLQLIRMSTHIIHLVSGGVDPGSCGGPDPLKICRRGQSMFWPPKISHCFIQNCFLHNSASFTSSRMKDLC